MSETVKSNQCCSGECDCHGQSGSGFSYASTGGIDISAVRKNNPWIEDIIVFNGQYIPVVSTQLTAADKRGALKARWGVNRMRYFVMPGLYAVGAPLPDSPVLVTANYKLTFDTLRSCLGGIDAWILVLDTAGVNVWCAAGKGTFGTEETVRRIGETCLDTVVSHRKLILPQLGAPGVSAHEVTKQSGFKVIYGPVRADDIKSFLENGMQATPEMRRVRFTFRDRLAVVPMELVAAFKYGGIAMLLLFLLSGLGSDGFSFERMLSGGIFSALFLFGALLTGAAVIPLLLPWIIGRAFAVKGLWAGVLYSLLAASAAYFLGYDSFIQLAGLSLLSVAAASFLAMNFTGATTFTSLSGVLREMRIAVPLQIAGAFTGAVLFAAGLLL